VTLTVVDGERVVDVHTHSNLVVGGAYKIMAGWTAYGPEYPDIISAIAVGEGGNFPGNPTLPLPPSEADTALNDEIARKNISVISNPEENETEFQTVFLTTEGNGDITEAGLFATSGDMFARVTFPVVSKSGTNLIVTWRITF
jgi:hypothetical protein